jgi:hypothetical protein
MNNRISLLVGMVLLLILALACGTSISGTGSGGEGEVGTRSGGTSLSKVSGPIDQFGSVYVAGIYFNTEGINPVVDGHVGQLSDLELGMWVTVEGNINTQDLTGTANLITYETHQAGNVTSLSSGNNFVLNGIIIETDQSTRYSANLNLPLSVHDRVHLSGQYLSSGNFYASQIGGHSEVWDRHRLPNELRTKLNQGEFLGLQIEVEQELNQGFLLSGNTIFNFQQAQEVIEGSVRSPRLGEKIAVRGQLLPSGIFKVLSWFSRDDEERKSLVQGQIQVLSAAGGLPHILLDGKWYFIAYFTQFEDLSHPRILGFGFHELRVGDTVALLLSAKGYVLKLRKCDP